jgi:hypothetical protein
MNERLVVSFGDTNRNEVIAAIQRDGAGIEGCSDFSDPDATELGFFNLSDQGRQQLIDLGAQLRKEVPMSQYTEYVA